MDEKIKVGDWVHSYSTGIWRVWRVLSGFNELRFSLEAPKVVSRRTLVFSNRLVNSSWKRSFSKECAELSLVRSISTDDASKVQELLQANPPLKVAFEKYQANNNSLDLVVNVSLGQLPNGGRERLRAVCTNVLADSIQNGMTMDEVLTILGSSDYHDCVGKTPSMATVQLICVNHEIRDREFVLRYSRVLDH